MRILPDTTRGDALVALLVCICLVAGAPRCPAVEDDSIPVTIVTGTLSEWSEETTPASRSFRVSGVARIGGSNLVTLELSGRIYRSASGKPIIEGATVNQRQEAGLWVKIVKIGDNNWAELPMGDYLFASLAIGPAGIVETHAEATTLEELYRCFEWVEPTTSAICLVGPVLILSGKQSRSN